MYVVIYIYKISCTFAHTVAKIINDMEKALHYYKMSQKLLNIFYLQ